MSGDLLAAVQAFAAFATVLVGAGIGLTGVRWIWQRTGRPSTPDGETLAQLQASLGRLDENERRVAELEERVDFAERMLAQTRPEAQLPGPTGDRR